jgi:putative aldouronate transport system substrate-binding protein
MAVAFPRPHAETGRRSFLGLLGLSALATAGGGVLAGCTSTPGGTGTSTNVNKLDAILPRYQALTVAKPDILVPPPAAPGYLSYPSSLADAITAKPGRGGPAIKVTTLNWGPVPAGLGSSKYLAAINTELGVEMDFTVNDGNTYADKLAALLGARDITDVMVVPSWNTNIPRFPDAVGTLFEDLTEYLKGDAVLKYPMLAAFPKGAWQGCVWGGRLRAVPFVNDNPFGWGLFYRKDILDKAGLKPPTTADELYQLGKAVTKPDQGVWAFADITDYVQMMFRVPGSQGGWRVEGGGKVVHKIETPEFKAALEFMAKLFKEGLVHPDLDSASADASQFFRSGKVVFRQDGLGGWQNLYREQRKADQNFKMQPVPVFAADGGKPLVWGSPDPIFYTFIKKDLGKDRVEEILGCLNWCAAPFGTKEWELRQYGVEGQHFTRGADNVPVTNDLYNQEYANQYTFLSGRLPAVIGGADTPDFVQDYTSWSNGAVKHLEENPWAGIKIEQPVKLSQLNTPTLDKIKDVVRGRRPLSEWDSIVADWRRNGGDEGRDFFAKALNG